MPDSEPVGLFGSARNFIDTGLAAVQNRAELLSVEFKEEKDHILEVGFWLTFALFFGIMTVLVLTATVILLFSEEYRIYAAGAFCIVYLAGTIWAILGLGFFFSKSRQRPVTNSNGRGLFAKAFAGYRLFRKVKPVWDGFRSWRV